MQTRVSALDGVRGIAIITILFHHAVQFGTATTATGWEHLVANITREGWIGVDLFFVLSGYLITGILLRTRENPHYFRNFYARRTLRIFPLYYASVLVMCTILPLFWHREYLLRLNHHQLWYWLYIPNFQVELNGNWFGDTFDHTWSLAIEEQFYLIWPLMVWLLGPRRLVVGSIGLAFVSFALRTWMWAHGYSEAQIRVLPFAHCDGLALGSLVAAMSSLRVSLFRMRQLATRLILVGISVRIIFGLLLTGTVDSLPPMLGIGWTLIFGGVIVWIVGSEGNANFSRFCANPVLTFFGKYSYGIYLIHYPLMIWSAPYIARLPSLATNAAADWLVLLTVCTGLTVALAVTSYTFFEMPFLRLKRFFE